jgi:tRNA modification GTPase
MEYNEIFREDDTITAIATPHGPGGIGIVRTSGAMAHDIMSALFVPASEAESFVPRHLYYGWIVEPASGERVDEVLAVWMKAPASYTGEDVVEFQCHSGPALLNRIIGLCLDAGARLAEPGEFTRRAFLNGRIDLIQAEAIAELASARSSTSGKLAMNMLQGGLKKKIEEVQELILNALASIEAAIDYPDESHEILGEFERSGNSLEKAISCLRGTASEFERGRLYREGASVVIAGRPNAGKSSLLNALAREDRAIVTPVPGTTRDAVEVEVNINDLPVRLTDTAGIRPDPDEVEEIGIGRVEKFLREAALVLWVVDASLMPGAEDLQAGEMIKKAGAIDRTLLVLNKSDLVHDPEMTDRIKRRLSALGIRPDKMPAATVSALDGNGLDILADMISAGILGTNRHPPEIAPNLRQAEALQEGTAALETAYSAIRAGMSPEIAAIDLRNGYRILGGIRGEDITSDLLDHIFTSFCLGK